MLWKRWLVLAAIAVLVSCGLVSCNRVGKRTGRAGGGTYRFTMVLCGSPGNPIWTKVIGGAREAADKLGCSVDVQFAETDAVKENNIIETAISNKVDGIGVILNYPDAYDKSVKRAIDNGIAVIAFNIDDPNGAAGNARMAFIGQDMQAAGYIIAKRLIKDGHLKKGDFVVCPAEVPELVYAHQRYKGARKAFDEVGIRSEVLRSGDMSLEDTLNKITQYLLGHKDTAAVLGLGGMPTEMAPQAIADVGMKIPNAGFDVTRRIAESIMNGKTIGTVDQQPYLQAFLTVSQLYYHKRYGFQPCDVNTGGAVIDKSNARRVVDLADNVR